MVPAESCPIEKSSWISLTRFPPGSLQWRPATCKLLDEDDRCLLNIYVDVWRSRPPLSLRDSQAVKETILYQTVYLHMLNHTDIRYADPSLFLRKNCIGISSAGCGFIFLPSFSLVDPWNTVDNDGLPVPAPNRCIFTLVILMLVTRGSFSFDPMPGPRYTVNNAFHQMADCIACGVKSNSL